MTSTTLTARAQTLIRTPPELVFAAFVDPAHMCTFWFPRSSGALEEGKTVHWFIGSGADELKIDVEVISVVPAERIVIEWGVGGSFTTAVWTFESQDDARTLLKIEESGFTGTPDEITARALDSTGGFNQVVIAAKAYLEHGVAVNIVTDHA